ncbi:MAG: toll/interleukin-1 receptor domain-containing protein [Propionibacteriaceae bacterium]|nr:toll/interleukin-1 receptor domain-containing protein [Propionibacteriaceae bacterium]
MNDQPIRCFLSYHREDNDEAFPGVIDRFFNELLGRLRAEAPVEVEVFRDVSTMVGGQEWRQRLREAVRDTLLFIPVVTVRYFQSDICMEELNLFRDNTPGDELNSAILPVVLAGHRYLKPDSDQEEIVFIEGLQWRDLRDAYSCGYESPTWRRLIGDVVDDILSWHEKFGDRHNTIQALKQALKLPRGYPVLPREYPGG